MPKGTALVAILKDLVVEEESSLTVQWRFNLPPFKTYGEHDLFRWSFDMRIPGLRIVHLWKQGGHVDYTFFSRVDANGEFYSSSITDDELTDLLKHFVIEQVEADWPWLADNLKIASLLPTNVREKLCKLRDIINAHDHLPSSARERSPVRKSRQINQRS